MKRAWRWAAFSGSRKRAMRTGSYGLGAVGAVGLAVFLGAGHGYPVQNVHLLPGSAWLASSAAGQVTLLDGASAEVAAQVQAAPAGHVLDVVQQGSTAYAIDETAGTLRRVDGATFSLTAPATPIKGATSGLTAFADPHQVYALDTQRGLLTTADPHTLATTGAQLSLAAQLSAGAATLDDAGRLWLVDGATGDLTRVADGTSEVHRSVAAPGKDLLALVNGKPVVVDTAGRKAVTVDPANGSPTGTLNLDLRPTDTIAVSGSPHTDRLYVVASRGVLDICDLAAHNCSDAVALDSNDNDLGAAVESGDRVFVPDYTTGQVWVIDLSQRTIVATAQVLSPAAKFQLLTRDGIVFFNDPNSERAGVINLDGVVTKVAKYDPADPTKGLPGHQPSTSAAPSVPQPPKSSSAPPSKPPSSTPPPSRPPTQSSSSPPGGGQSATPTAPLPTGPFEPPSAPPSSAPTQVGPPSSAPSSTPSSSSAPPPTLKITLTDPNPVVKESVNLEVSADRGTVANATWQFGDGGTSAGTTATHAWTTAGGYQIVVHATMQDGTSVQTSLSITVSKIPQVKLTVSVPAGGSVSGGGINCPGVCTATIDKGTAVTLTVTPQNPNYSFGGWGGACSGSAASCALTLDANKSVSVGFNPTAYAFNGWWGNANAQTGYVPEIQFTATSPTSGSLHDWGMCHPSYCDWGTVTATLSGGALDATFSSSSTKVHLTIANGQITQVAIGSPNDTSVYNQLPFASSMYDGTWVVAPSTGNTAQLQFTSSSDVAGIVHGWGECTPLCDWGNAAAAWSNGALDVTYTFSFEVMTLHIELAYGKLEITGHNHFTDSSGRKDNDFTDTLVPGPLAP